MAGVTSTWNRPVANAWMAAKLGGPTGASSPWKLGLVDANNAELTSAAWPGYARQRTDFGAINPPSSNAHFLMPDDDENTVLQNLTRASFGPFGADLTVGGYLLFNSDASASQPVLTVDIPNVLVANGKTIYVRAGTVTLTLAQLRGR